MANITRQVEVRAAKRILSGVVMQYGQQSPSHRERFEPGSIRLADTVTLNLEHRRMESIAHYPGGGLSLDDTGDRLEMRAELPPIPAANVALQAIERGQITGLSVEFYPERETRADGIRVIQQARIDAVGLVRTPSYPASRVEVRAARSEIPYKMPLPCWCSGKQRTVKIDSIEIPDDRDVLAIAGDYKRAFASRNRGTLTLTETNGGMSVEVADQALEAGAGRELVEQSANVPIVARPVINDDLSKSHDEGGITVYDVLVLKAVLFGATDQNDGSWPEVDFTGGATEPDQYRSANIYEFPIWL